MPIKPSFDRPCSMDALPLIRGSRQCIFLLARKVPRTALAGPPRTSAGPPRDLRGRGDCRSSHYFLVNWTPLSIMHVVAEG